MTKAELRVIHLMAERLTNQEMGERLGCSPRTVESHLTRIFVKVGLRSRQELSRAARKWVDQGWLEPGSEAEPRKLTRKLRGYP